MTTPPPQDPSPPAPAGCRQITSPSRDAGHPRPRLLARRQASPAQRAASRANGARSRGPTSLLGKRRSSQNARRHGCYARTPRLLSPTELHQFHQLLQGHRDELAPSTARHEQLLVEAVWNLFECVHWEGIADRMLEHDVTLLRRYYASRGFVVEDPWILAALAFARLSRHCPDYEKVLKVAARHERRYFRALAELERIRPPGGRIAK